MSGVDTDAAASTAASKAESVGSATTIGGVADVQSATFVVTEANGIVSFGGSATGSIVMTLTDDGGATFSRAGVTGKASTAGDAASVKISDVANKTISGSIDLAVVVTGNATAGDDQFVINAPDATKITVRGDMGDGADSIVIKVADDQPGVTDVRPLTVDTSSLSVGSDDSIVFDFAAAEDLVILSSASNIAQFSTVEVAKGTADMRSVIIKDGADFIVNSGLQVCF